jgi:RNA polymerase sigma-70 factor (ECF subfamily)
MHTTPLSLLERVRNPGDNQAWGRFVEMYTPLLYYWARRTGLQESDAADLIQDVFAVLVSKLPAFVYDRSRSFRGWLRTILHNKWRDRERRLAAAPDLRDIHDLTILADPLETNDFWDVEYRQHLVGRALELMQREFQPATWRACWEVVVSGRSPADVAAELGMTVDAVYTAKSRVLRRLRQELAMLID